MNAQRRESGSLLYDVVAATPSRFEAAAHMASFHQAALASISKLGLMNVYVCVCVCGRACSRCVHASLDAWMHAASRPRVDTYHMTHRLETYDMTYVILLHDDVGDTHTHIHDMNARYMKLHRQLAYLKPLCL